MILCAKINTFFLNEQMFEVVFLEESISLYNEKSKCENTSILRKYGSICMGEKTRSYFRLLSRISRRMVGSSWICSAVSPLFSTSSATAG